MLDNYSIEKKCSCIIPVFNEARRIAHVLSVVVDIKEIAQIICVDDGSTDNSAECIAQQFPKVEVLHLQNNKGKTAAVEYGIKLAKASTILLLDADIEGITRNEIINAINIMQEKHTIDMLILRRMNASLEVKLSRSDIVISGERIVRREDLLRVLKTKPQGYQLETAINMYMIYNHKTVYWFPCSTTHLLKREKYGLLKGFTEEITMHWSAMKYAGVTNYIKQFLFFAQKKYSYS